MATKKISQTQNNSDELQVIKAKVTAIEDLMRYREGEVVELPPFGPDMPFVARLRRPSILLLAKDGKIPNTLLDTANSLFTGKDSAKIKKDNKTLRDTFEVFDILCSAAFVSPTWDEIREAGIELTDEQFVFIFNYTQRGQKALKSFRQKQGDN